MLLAGTAAAARGVQGGADLVAVVEEEATVAVVAEETVAPGGRASPSGRLAM